MKKSENLMNDQKFRQEAWNSLCQSEFPSHCTKGKLLFVKPRIISVQFLSVSALGLTKYLGASLWHKLYIFFKKLVKKFE
jgi:hypothetical protein